MSPPMNGFNRIAFRVTSPGGGCVTAPPSRRSVITHSQSLRQSPGAATAVIASHGGAEKGATILLALSRLYLCPVNEQNICQIF